MRQRLRPLLLLPLTAGLIWAEPARLEKAESDRFLSHVQVLADPALRGRGAGMPGLERAARYIAGQFEKYGLIPGAGRSYLQPFTVTTNAEMGEDNGLVVTLQGEERSHEPGKDYVPLNFSAAGSVSGEVVFVGYGISAEEFGYDDYFHLDVRDKIVIALRYEPKSFDKEKGEQDKRYTHHSHLISKAINARDRGAKAVVLVNAAPRSEEEEDLLIKFGSVSGPDDAGILMVQAKRQVVDRWLEESETSLAELQETIEEEETPQSFGLGAEVRVDIEVDVVRRHATVHNVAGHLPGQSEEFIVIGAHYDHLGLGGEGSLAPSKIGEVHPGADDNASGTAALIELARVFSARRDGLERGILFLAFAGEEIGLLGSSYWVNEPTLPLDNAAAMLNMDMVGRIRKSKVYIGGVGTGSTFDGLLKRLTKDSALRLDFSKLGASSSDHTSFLSKGVPSLFFFSGLHSDYHKPSDTWDKIDGASAVQLVNLVADVADHLVNGAERPEFIKVKPEAPRGGGGGGGYGAYFGSVPDFGEIENGVKFADISEGSPAQQAGALPGDILIQFDGSAIKNLYDFTYALRAHKPGDEVEVIVQREGKEVTLKVKLGQRQ